MNGIASEAHGRCWDHVKKVRQALRGLQNKLRELERKLAKASTVGEQTQIGNTMDAAKALVSKAKTALSGKGVTAAGPVVRHGK